MAIFTAIATAIFGAGTFLAAAGAFVLQTVAGIGLSLLAQKIAGKKPQSSSQAVGFSVQGKLQSGGDVSRSFNLGYSATAGSLTYANFWGTSGGTPNAYFTQVIALSDLPVADLVEVWVNGEICTLGDTPHAEYGYPVIQYRSGGVDYLWVKFYDGTQTEADSFLVSKVASLERPYTASRIGTGIAYVICTSLVNDALFTGFPQFKFAVLGAPLYDPSKDSTVGGTGTHRWSDPSTWGGDGDHLPVVQIYNLLRGFTFGGEWFYGLQNMAAARLPTSNWIAQIEKCRAEIEGVDGNEPTYRSGAQITVSAQLADAVEAFLTACQGKLSEIGGFYKMHCGAPDSPSFFFTDADIISDDEQSFTPFFGLADTINGIAARYPSPPEGWNTKPAPALYRPDFEVQDGKRRLLADVSLDTVPYSAQVQRLMKSALDEARRARRHTHVMPPDFWIVEPGDIGVWTSERNGYTTKLFRVDGLIDRANLDVLMDLTEVDPSDFDWSHGDDYTPVYDGPTTFPRPPAQAIVDWAVEPAILRDDEGFSRRPAIIMSWDGEMPDVDGVEFEIRQVSNGEVVYRGRTDNPAAGTILITQSLLPATSYEARGRYIPASSRDTLWSDWIAVTTPDVKLSVLDFEGELEAVIGEEFIDQAEKVDKIIQLIASVAADQDAANWLDKRNLRNTIAVQEGRLGASIEEVRTVALDTEASFAAFQLTVNATLDDQTAQIEETFTAIATVDGKLAATAQIITNVGGKISGFKNYNDGTTSLFDIEADFFRIGKSGVTGGAFVPVFTVGTVSGAEKIIFRGDMYGEGTITANKLNVATLSAITADIGTVTAGMIRNAANDFQFDVTNGQLIGYGS